MTRRHRPVSLRPPVLLCSGSLGSARRDTRHGVIFDGSQLGGSKTDASYGTLDLVSQGAPSNAIPSGVTLIRDGVTKTSYDLVHGIEPGVIEGARRSGKTSGMVVLTRSFSSVSAQTWLDGNFATVAADVATAGLTPSWAMYALGGPDATSAQQIGRIESRLRALQNLVWGAWPGCAFLVSGLMSTDLASFPFQTQLRAAGRRVLNDRLNNRCAYWPPNDFESYLQLDDTHLTSRGLVLYGLDGWRILQRYGVPR